MTHCEKCTTETDTAEGQWVFCNNESCPCHTMHKNNWEESFENLEVERLQDGVRFMEPLELPTGYEEVIKSFIQSILTKQREEDAKGIRGMKKETCQDRINKEFPYSFVAWGYGSEAERLEDMKAIIFNQTLEQAAALMERGMDE